MTTADGSVIGTTQISGGAPRNRAFNLVLLAEGFTAAQQGDFDNACAAFLTAFTGTPPFDDLAPAINVFRVNVSSTDSGADDPAFQAQMDQHQWPQMKARFTALFKTRSRDAWCALLEGTDVCFAPVLDMAEAPAHPHNQARGTFIDIEGVIQPAPAPRFSRTAPATPLAPSSPGQDSVAILADWGFTAESIEALRGAEVI